MDKNKWVFLLERQIRVVFYVFMLFSMIACGSNAEKENQSEQESKDAKNENSPARTESADLISISKNGITLQALAVEKDYSEASLKLADDFQNPQQAGEHNFLFEVDNFELAEQTKGERSKRLANSAKGQHIHFILNNGPYQAEYNAEFTAELNEGYNVVLAFLSRSYHESVKSNTAFVFKAFTIGEDFPPFDEKAPHLIYSRPKGEYDISEKEEILLDFYLLNAELSDSGYRVKVMIDETEFVLSQWLPFSISGLSAGEHNFRIQLIDQEGKVVPGPFNDSGLRSIKLTRKASAS